jgi:hypothetical protein
MNTSDTPHLRPILVGLFALAAIGCERPEGDRLVIATPWTSAERASIETDYRRELPMGPAIAWVPLDSGDDPSRLVPGLGVDLVLGLPAEDLDRLLTEKVLTPIDEGEARPWRVARRQSLGMATNHGPGLTGVAFDDPRFDTVTLAWAKARLKSDGWAKGYAELVRTSAIAQRIGRAGSGAERVARGEAAAAPAVGIVGAIDDRSTLVRLEGASDRIEGVAIVHKARREAAARAFLAFLAERGQAGPIPPEVPPYDPVGLVADDLLADLLGATLVDSQDELWAAMDVVELAGRPPAFERYLDDAPPWPPTSVVKLKDSPDPLALLETLAREITPDRDARFWLLESWDGPEHAIDGAWLREAASAAGGRLASEPRFRAWLRGEWTAWARQHYRRIAREAGKDGDGR